MPSRVELLQQMIERDPNNEFARYALAQDYVSSGWLEEAWAEFARLIEINPDYTAAYFHGGKALEGLGRAEQAREVYQRGVAACERAGNAHALSEMRAALEELG